MSKHMGRKKRGNSLSNKLEGHDLHVCYHELMSRVWSVNTLFRKVGKSGFFQTQLEVIQEHPSSLAINNLNNSFVFPLYLEHLEIKAS